MTGPPPRGPPPRGPPPMGPPPQSRKRAAPSEPRGLPTRRPRSGPSPPPRRPLPMGPPPRDGLHQVQVQGPPRGPPPRGPPPRGPPPRMGMGMESRGRSPWGLIGGSPLPKGPPPSRGPLPRGLPPGPPGFSQQQGLGPAPPRGPSARNPPPGAPPRPGFVTPVSRPWEIGTGMTGQARVFLPFDPRTKRPEPGTVPDLYPNPYSNPYPGSRPGPGQGHFIPSPRGLPASRPQTFQVVSKNTPIGVPFFGIFTATCLGGIEFKSGQGRFGSKK